jgi:hypothetical protein
MAASEKDGQVKPLFKYQRQIYDALMFPATFNSRPAPGGTVHNLTEKKQRDYLKHTQQNYLHDFKIKHLWVKKATGLGITELLLRIMAWLCLRNNDNQNSQMCIVTGPNQDMAIKLIKRMKGLFESNNIYFDTKETVIELNKCSIEAYPSNHIDTFRSLTNPKFILLDEADYFKKSEQDEVRQVAERYIGKSDPFIVLVSTPNSPQGMFNKIEHEPFETCIYKRLYLDYTYGLDRIYTKEEIEKAKMSPSFEREYCLKYLGLEGNLIHPKFIDRCQQISYDSDQIIPDSRLVCGIDPSFGSSKFGIVGTRFYNERIYVVIAEEHDRPEFDSMIKRIWEIKQNNNISTIYVDAANPEVWSSLKRMFDEPHDIKYVSDKLNWCSEIKQPPSAYMKVVPVAFSSNGARMLQHVKNIMEDPNNIIAIDKRFDKLLTSLRTAYSNEFKLDKEKTEYNDIFDAFRLALSHYNKRNT